VADGADGYRISIGTTAGGTNVVDGEEVNGTTYNHATDWEENTTYYVTVVPYNAAGEADGCIEISFTTTTLLVAPECTTIIRPRDGESSISLNDGIAWTAVEGAEGYYVAIGTTPSGSDLVDADIVVGTTYHPKIDFKENTPYYIRVIPFNAAGEATSCSELRFLIIPDTRIQRTKYGISPNGDGINDNWQIDGIERHPENSVAVFSRWGDLVFFLKDYDNQSKVFDGKANKLTRLGGGILPAGTYFFVIEYKEDNTLKKIEGMLVIKR
ncbi:gliding motility-associated C-terminal domain-containing protein, partial [Parapedobacter pyrenivorans]|uniref:T9SS type B sorting domain-containing protein n=1 Tax=Parapedobacter pyrenivorans TaxID=1305674 RepID=UPI00166F3EAB